MKTLIKKLEGRSRRHQRVRAKIFGTEDRPRLSFNRSNKNIYAQLINDDKGETIVGVSSLKIKEKGAIEQAKVLGEQIAKESIKKGVSSVVFDKGGFLYTGSVKAFADSARSAGLKF